MFNPCANITIKSDKTWVFKKITACEIERDVEKVTATCKLTLPKNTKWHGETSIPVKRGDKITIELGYGETLHAVFEGYIKSVGVKTPIEIECEDLMYLLKNTPAKKKSYPDATLETLLAEQLPPGVKFETFAKESFGKYTVNSDTVSQLLGELAEVGITSFFRGDTLYSGMIHSHEEIGGLKQKFFTGEKGNIIDEGDLEWSRSEDTLLRIKASGTDLNGKKISVEVGDKDGELRSYFKYNTTKETLEAEATRRLKDWKIGGLSGSFTTFVAKPVWLLDRIKVQTEYAPVAVYKVIKNTITYDTGGYRQDITIGGKTA
jgi:hypothetical protein